MKKILPLLVILGLYLSTSAQIIEVIGTGTYGVQEVDLPEITNPENVSKIILNAHYQQDDVVTPPAIMAAIDDIVFTDANGSYNVSYNSIDYGTDAYRTWYKWDAVAYFTKTIDPYTDGTISVNSGTYSSLVQSFFAFVYRDLNNPDAYSVASTEQAYVYQNGYKYFNTKYQGPYVYSMTINASNNTRNLSVTVPMTEINTSSDDRVAVVRVTAGDVMDSLVITDNNYGDFLSIETLVLTNVAGDVTEVLVEVYSPMPSQPNINDGDSFIVGGCVVTVETDGDGCTLTQGYWKTHANPNKPKKYDETWDLIGGSGTTFYLSGDSYLGVFNTPVKGNKYYSLAHQFMAVHLNFLNGANPSAVFDAYSAAKLLFETYTPAQVKADSDLNAEFGSYIGILTDYNEGTIGPGHCDEKSTYADIETSIGSEMNIYPNPMSNSGTIDFTAENEVHTTVDLYNVMGQKVATLFDGPAQMGQQYQIKIDANRYQKGLYIVYLNNGPSTITKKININ
jgi:hypothetical protein